MQSDMRSARRLLWLCSPSTHDIASTIFDFPQPFGPTMQVRPVPLNVTDVRSQKLLNPVISTFLSFSKVTLSFSVTYAPAPTPKHGTPRRIEMRVPLPRLGENFDKNCGRTLSRAHPPGATMAVRNENLSEVGPDSKTHSQLFRVAHPAMIYSDRHQPLASGTWLENSRPRPWPFG
jgi:hypothetical protein